jgi:hydroxyquinol 1,2-dioxygenase
MTIAGVTERTVTEQALERWATAHSPRLREVMASLISHLHAFANEVRPTEEEWLAACTFLAETGRLSDDKRQEFILLSDVLGVSTLIVGLNNQRTPAATPNTVLGPFHIDASPELPNAGDMAGEVQGEPCYITGTVRDLEGNPIAGAKLDVWQADPDGLYEVQVRGQVDPRLRAIFHSAADGTYCFRTVVPRGYAIPMDGTVGELIRHTDVSYFRPAHVHFIVEASGYQRLVTHLFRAGDPYLESDAVYGVKPSLITPFAQQPAGKTPDGGTSDRPFSQVQFDFFLEPVR